MKYFIEILLFILAIIIVGIISYFLINLIAKKYSRKKQNEYLENILKLLPNDNCGKCKSKTCNEFAKNLLYKTNEDKCELISNDDNKTILNYIDTIYSNLNDYSYYDKKKKEKDN